MSKIIAQMMFNPFMQRFLSDYCATFPECTHARDNLKRVLDELEGEDVSFIMELFLTSFSPFEKRLKARDVTLFNERSCEFVHHLQIKDIWTPDLDEVAQTQIWDDLIGGYLIAEILVRLPSSTLVQIESMFLRQFNNVMQDDFDKSQFKGAAENIILNLDENDIQLLVNYMWEFMTSDATPIYHLIPEKFHFAARLVFGSCKTEEGRQSFLTTIMPLIEQIKGKVVGADNEIFNFVKMPKGERNGSGEDDDDDSEKEGDEADDESQSEDDEEAKTEQKLTEEEEKERKEKDKAEKQRMVSHVLNVMTELIAKNTDMLRNLSKNPIDSISTFVDQTLLPTLTHSRSMGARKSADEMKRIQDKKDRKLFGPSHRVTSNSNPTANSAQPNNDTSHGPVQERSRQSESDEED